MFVPCQCGSENDPSLLLHFNAVTALENVGGSGSIKRELECIMLIRHVDTSVINWKNEGLIICMLSQVCETVYSLMLFSLESLLQPQKPNYLHVFFNRGYLFIFYFFSGFLVSQSMNLTSCSSYCQEDTCSELQF